MKKYTAVLLAALAILITVAAHTASAADNVSSMTNVYDSVDTNHKLGSDEQYPAIDLFGEKEVPLFATNGNIVNIHVNKLAKLLLDCNESYTIRDGEKLDLGQGYALGAKQIDIDGMKVWLEFTKDGQHVADQTISVKPDSNRTWTVALDNVQGENNIVVMKVHINNLFAGATDNIVRIDGLWLTDYANASTLKVGDRIGEFTLEKIVNGANESNLGSLVFENNTRSSVTCNVVGTHYKCDSWSNKTADTVSKADNDSIRTNVCDVVGTNYKWGPNEQYPVIDLFGEKYVPLYSTDGKTKNIHVNKLSKLIIDSNEPHRLEDGEKLDLGQGYALEAKQINIYKKEAWLEFTRDGQHVADKVVSSLGDDNLTWTVALDNVQDENNIIVMRVHVKEIGGLVENNTVKHSSVNLDGIWLTDYANAITLQIGDEMGESTLKKIVNGSNISNQGSLIFESSTGSPVTCNIVGTNYKCDGWSSQYPLINLFGETYVPLLANNNPIWECHVDKLAKLVLDSSDKHSMKVEENLDLGQGYSIQIKEIDIPGKKVWIEFDKDGQYVDDSIISTDPYDNKWTCTLNPVQDENEIPVLKVYVKDVYQDGSNNIVQINGIWLIDYKNARTLKIGDRIGDYTLETIASGTTSSNLGSLAFKKTQTGNSSAPNSDKEPFVSTNKSINSPISWFCDFWSFLTIKK